MNDADLQKLATLINNRPDRDSFASFTGGLRSNWAIIIAVMGAAMWIFNSFTAQATTNLQQDSRIEALSTSIDDLAEVVDSLARGQEQSVTIQSEIRQDIALIKVDISSIKDKVK